MTPLEQKIYNFAKDNNNVITWKDFINLSLFDEDFGYYKKDKIRVGKDGDFFTSASLKHKVFGEAMKIAAENILLQNGENPDDFEIIEIGAEPNYQMIDNTKTIKLGQNINLQGNLIVLSNELLDSRPFERFTFKNNRWQKRAITFGNSFSEHEDILISPSEDENDILLKYFPKAKVEGFNIDISIDAHNLFKKICKQKCNAVFLFADYFRSAEEISLLPMGTARTYANHKQDSDLFSNVGETDITFSPCFDIFENIAKDLGKKSFTKTQEAFIVEYASNYAENIITSKNKALKRELCQLISPAHMGAYFRILTVTN